MSSPNLNKVVIMKKTLALVLAILMIVTCFAACGNTNGEDSSMLYDDPIGIKIPQENLRGVKKNSFTKFNAVDLDGNKITEDIFKGKKLTMINIWATFCDPCISEMPDLNTLHETYADKDVQVIGIVCDVGYAADGYIPSLYESAVDIVEATGVTFKNLLPSKSLDMIKLEEVYSVPETLFVDEDGNIVGSSYIGSRSLQDWQIIVDSVLASMD